MNQHQAEKVIYMHSQFLNAASLRTTAIVKMGVKNEPMFNLKLNEHIRTLIAGEKNKSAEKMQTAPAVPSTYQAFIIITTIYFVE